MKSNIKNITGQRFGRLVAVKPTNKRTRQRKIVWLCRCDCGNMKKVRVDSLTRGRTKSCGCYKKEYSKKRVVDITGQRFGRLVAVKPTNERWRGCVVWLCQCDCGNMKKVRADSLTGGHTKSCGCYKTAGLMTRRFLILDPDDIPLGMIRVVRQLTKIKNLIKDQEDARQKRN
jgi:hypothetical protein